MLRAMKYSALALGVLLAVTFEPMTAAAAKMKRGHHATRKQVGKHRKLVPMKKVKSEKLPERNVTSEN